ncbi:MAG: ribosome maturation factor RimM [Chromatiaceae bacterium]
MTDDRTLVVGRISGLYGVHGLVKILSETDPKDAILGYNPWLLGDDAEVRTAVEGRRHGKGLVARIHGCEDREQAALLVGQTISVSRKQLPPLGDDEFYWADLEGLAVVTLEGVRLGKVHHLFATAGNDVLAVQGERERLIPFIWGDVVTEVNLELGLMRVTWDPDF